MRATYIFRNAGCSWAEVIVDADSLQEAVEELMLLGNRNGLSYVVYRYKRRVATLTINSRGESSLFEEGPQPQEAVDWIALDLA